MNNGEKRQIQIKKFLSQLRTNIEVKASNKQYIAFRAILLASAFFLITGNWLAFERHENYRIGYPSAKTYFALTSSRLRTGLPRLSSARRQPQGSLT